MLKKKTILICIVLIFFLIIIFFIKNYYNYSEVGNNKSNKSIEEIEEYILNIDSYEAKISVTVESNKNTNKYVMIQKYKSPNTSHQIILEPSNIEGVEIINDGKNLSIKNTKLNLNSIYENYEYAVNNCLNLESFIYDYKQNNGSIYYENNEIVLEAKSNSENKLMYNKKLYINEQTGNPTKLLIEDINEKKIVYTKIRYFILNNWNNTKFILNQTVSQSKFKIYQ